MDNIWNYYQKLWISKIIIDTKKCSLINKKLLFQILWSPKISKEITSNDYEVILDFLKSENRNDLYISFNKITFKENFKIKNYWKDIVFNFFECKFEKEFLISKCEIKNLLISYCDFIWQVDFNQCRFINNFTIRAWNFNSPVFINQCTIYKILNLVRWSFKTFVEIKNSPINKVSITNYNKSLSGYTSGTWKIKITYNEELNDICYIINEIKLERLQDIPEISIWALQEWKLRIKNLIIDRLYMHEKDWWTFLMYNAIIDNFSYLNSTNTHKHVVLSNISISNKLILKFVKLTKSTFNTLSINKLYIENSSLEWVNFNWVKFPNWYELIEIKKNNWKIDYVKMRDNYRQLKSIMDKNWNYIDANYFYWNEIRHHVKNLFLFNPDRIIFYIQCIVSDYWNKWFMPLVWIFMASNSRLVIIKEYKSESYNWWEYTYIENILQWIVPFISFSTNTEMSIWSFIYNSVLVFLIYHFWVSLRRTTKR